MVLTLKACGNCKSVLRYSNALYTVLYHTNYEISE